MSATVLLGGWGGGGLKQICFHRSYERTGLNSELHAYESKEITIDVNLFLNSSYKHIVQYEFIGM